MASSVVGVLKVLFTAETGDYKAGLDEAGKITTQFSGKLDGMSTQLGTLSKAFRLVLGAAALREIADYAGQLQDLSAQTGLTTDSLQQMAHAAKQTGSSLEAFTNAAFRLGVNLAGGGNSVEAAVTKLGLAYAELMKLTPDEQFRQIASALGRVEDAQLRNKLAVDLFGKGAKEILPAIAEGYDKIAGSAQLSGKEQIKAIDDAGDALSNFKNDVLSMGVLVGGTFVRSVQQATTAWGEFLQGLMHTKESQASAAAVLEALGLKAVELPKALNASAVAAGNLPAPLKSASMSATDLAAASKKLDDELAISVERNKAAAEAAKQFAESLKELSGQQAAAGAQNVLKQLEALGGPLKVLPSQLKAMADQLREGAQAALLAGNANLAGQYTLLAKTLDPIIQFQQRYNVTIGEYAQEAQGAADFTEELNEQLNRLGGTVITIGPLLQSSLDLSKMFERFKEGVTSNLKATEKPLGDFARAWTDTMSRLPGAIIAAIQGGGSIIGAAGGTIGAGLMKGFTDKFGPAIRAALPFGIGEAVTALLPTLGALFGPIAEKIGGFFRRIFGGPSSEELRGRQAVADFEDQLHGLLNETQLAEAGNEDWKKTVIAIRDAYLAAGHTEAEALAAAERLWASSKKGAAETAAAIAAIQAIINQTKSATNELDAVMDRTFQDRTMTVTQDVVLRGSRDDGEFHPEGEGFATGTLGRLGQWFGRFPQSGLSTSLHGVEAVVTPSQAPAFAMDVLSSNSQFAAGAQQTAAQQQPMMIRNVVENHLFLDGHEVKKWILKETTSAIDNNEYGSRSKMRDALGVTS